MLLKLSFIITKVLPEDPFLLMNMSTLQRAELLMEMSTPRALAASGRVYTTEVCTAPGSVYTTGACAAHWCCSWRHLQHRDSKGSVLQTHKDTAHTLVV